jgi:hypothetical protein
MGIKQSDCDTFAEAFDFGHRHSEVERLIL